MEALNAVEEEETKSEERKPLVEILEADREAQFEACARNYAMLLLMAIEFPHFISQTYRMKLLFFLRLIKSHFLDSHSRTEVWTAVDYLILFFMRYPLVSIPECRQAFEAVRTVYRALNIDLEATTFNPNPLSWRKEIKRFFRRLFAKRLS